MEPLKQNNVINNAVVVLKRIEIYPCNICSQAFLNQDDYCKHIWSHILHAKVVLRKQRIFQCKKCTAGFLNKDDLHLHKVYHVMEKVRTLHSKKNSDKMHYKNVNIVRNFKCTECGRRFALESTLQEHLVVHQPFPYRCFCGIAYLNEIDFKGHQKLIHNTTQTITKINSNDKNNHNNSKTTPKVIYKEDSEEEFYDDYRNNCIKDEMSEPKQKKRKMSAIKIKPKVEKRRVYKFYPQNNTYVSCTICSQQMKKYYLPRHMEIHSGKKYQCDECDKYFNQQVGLTNHKKNVHERRGVVQCEICKKILLNKYNLLIHLRIHTGEKPYSCKYCDKSFSDKSAHQRHERIHTKDYKYFCTICDKSYTDKSALIGHNKRNHTETQSCDICDAKFVTVKELNVHLATHLG